MASGSADPGAPRTDEIAELLKSRLGGEWQVARFDDGSTSRSFVATHGPDRRFVKPDIRTDVVQRVAAMGIAPPVVGAGVRDGRPYVIQEWIEAASPAPDWFAAQLDAWADVVTAYQGDATLREVLAGSELQADAYADALVRRAGGATAQPAQVAQRLRASAPRTADLDVVPTHGDPNVSNFLIASGRVHLVDWDDAALSDPMRDIGQILWWYVPEEQWPRALARLGLPDRNDVRDRLYWWVAAESLDVSLRLYAEGNDRAGAGFLADAVSALEHRPNPPRLRADLQ